jgi:radical SAM superfamily enzyme YgiQ (UPF0313 family)
LNPPSASGPIPDILRKERWLETFPHPESGAAPVVAGYPAPYRVGMSNLGFHFLLRRLKASRALSTERFFADTSPLTLESGASISRASFLFVSISYEEDYLNLARILLQAGVPPLAAERLGRPLIVAGGPAPSANPFPLADIVDCCVLGEGERPLDGIIGIIEREPSIRPEVLLEKFAALPGVFVPSVSAGDAGYSPTAGETGFCHSVVVTPDAVFSDTLLVEIGRGCPGSCAFCLASAVFRPYRAMKVGEMERLLDSIEHLPAVAGFVSTAVAADSDFGGMMRACLERGMRVALSSVRAEDLDEEKACLIGSAGVRSVSFAPESGSETLRFRLGKRVPSETYMLRARELSDAGVRSFKLYLLVGCPGETDGDVRETESFLCAFKEAACKCRVSVNVNAVVPKAWTPMQFYAMPPEEVLKSRMELLRRMCRDLGIAVRTKSIRSALRQAVLSLGDARTGRAVLGYTRGGISWKRALEEAGIDPGMPHVTRGIDRPLPWDAITGPVHRELLERRYRQIVALNDG